MATHSSTLAWKIPWTEEPGRLQSMGSLGVGYDWATLLSFFTFHFHALEKEMATHVSVLAWRIPGTGEPGGLLSLGLHSRTRLKRLSSSSSVFQQSHTKSWRFLISITAQMRKFWNPFNLAIITEVNNYFFAQQQTCGISVDSTWGPHIIPFELIFLFRWWRNCHLVWVPTYCGRNLYEHWIFS